VYQPPQRNKTVLSQLRRKLSRNRHSGCADKNESKPLEKKHCCGVTDENPVTATESNGTIEGHEAVTGYPHQLCDPDMAQQADSCPGRVLGPAPAGTVAPYVGSGGPTWIEHAGGIDLWHPECAKRYFAAMNDPPASGARRGQPERICRQCTGLSDGTEHPTYCGPRRYRRQASR